MKNKNQEIKELVRIASSEVLILDKLENMEIIDEEEALTRWHEFTENTEPLDEYLKVATIIEEIDRPCNDNQVCESENYFLWVDNGGNAIIIKKSD